MDPRLDPTFQREQRHKDISALILFLFFVLMLLGIGTCAYYMP